MRWRVLKDGRWEDNIAGGCEDWKWGRGEAKDGRLDVVKMRRGAALEREMYSKGRCRRSTAILLGETGLDVLSSFLKS